MEQKIKHIGEISPISEIIKLDKMNRKIISLLMFNDRINYSQLSKYLKLSKSNIIRRINIMKKNKIITGDHAFIDISKLKLNSGLILLQTNCTETQKEKYVNKIINNGWVYGMDEITGKYDLLISFYYKNDSHRDELIEQLINFSLTRNFSICDIKTIFTRFDYFSEISSSEKTNELQKIKNLSEYSKLFQKLERKINVDKTDIKLLGLLSQNCRLNFIGLGEKLKISRETVNYKIKKLIQGKVIAKFQPTINPFILGFEGHLLMIKLKKPTQKNKLIDYLENTQRCNTILVSSEDYGIITFVHCKNNAEFRKFENDFISKFKDIVYEYTFELVKNQHKLDWFPTKVKEYLVGKYK